MSDTSQDGSPRFSPEVEAILRRSGWFPGRQVAEDEMAKWYVLRWQDAPGYRRIFPAAYRFLREFGGIDIVLEHPLPFNSAGLHSLTESFVIDPLQTLESYEDMWIHYELSLETCLYPLALRETGHVLHIDIQGRFWSLDSENWEPYLEGHTTEQALANILELRTFGYCPPQPVGWTPLEQLPVELIEHIARAEQKAVPPNRYCCE